MRSGEGGACASCLRRTRLIALLAPHIDRERGHPERSLLPAVDRGRGQQQGDSDRRAGAQTRHRAAKGRGVAAGDHEQPDVGEADDSVRAGEREGVVAEGAGHSERGGEERCHRDEHRESDGALLGVDDARQPRIAGPWPPEDGQHEEATEKSLPGLVVRHQRRALRHREHEYEIEEQLERRDAPIRAPHGSQARHARL